MMVAAGVVAPEMGERSHFSNSKYFYRSFCHGVALPLLKRWTSVT